MIWTIEALKLLAKKETVPGIALQDAIEEIERLTKRERRDCATILHLRDELKKANQKIEERK